MTEASESKDDSAALTAGSEVTFDIVCTPCNNDGDINEASVYCIQCTEYLCVTCLKYHNKLAGSKYHSLVDKESVPGIQGSLPIGDVCTQRCQIHTNEIIKYYCPTHKTFGCGDCMLRTHDACKGKLYIPDEAQNIPATAEFKDFQTLIEKLIKKANDIIKSSHCCKQFSAACRVKALKEIENFRQEVNVALDELKTALEEQTEGVTTKDEVSQSAIEDLANQVLVDLQRISSDLNTVLSKGQLCQVFIEMKSREGRVWELKRQLENIETNDQSTLRFKPNKDLQTLMRRQNALGDLLVKKPAETKATFVADINVKSSDNTKTCWISGTALLSNKELVIIDWKNKTLKLIDTEQLHIISEYKPERAPNDGSVIKNNQIAVTLPGAKKIIIMRSEDKLIFEREIQVNHTCRKIVCYDDKLVVSFRDPHEVRILSLTGEILQTFSTTCTGERLFNDVPRLAISAFTKTIHIYATDWEANLVTMLDMDGTAIAEYKDDDLKNPTYAAVDDEGMVYVCGCNSNNIHIMTPYCSKVKILLAAGDGIKLPNSVSYCEETRKLYIGMQKNDIVKVFQLS